MQFYEYEIVKLQQIKFEGWMFEFKTVNLSWLISFKKYELQYCKCMHFLHFSVLVFRVKIKAGDHIPTVLMAIKLK